MRPSEHVGAYYGGVTFQDSFDDVRVRHYRRRRADEDGAILGVVASEDGNLVCDVNV
jgi:hypothetical protein